MNDETTFPFEQPTTAPENRTTSRRIVLPAERHSGSSSGFLALFLVSLSVLITLGFQMMDQISARLRLQAGIAQQEPAFVQTVQVQRQIEKLLTDFQRTSPAHAQELFKQFNIRIGTPPQP